MGADVNFENYTWLSGQYNYYSTKDGSDIFVRDELLYRVNGEEVYLIYRNGFWFLANHTILEIKANKPVEGFLRLKTTGNHIICNMVDHKIKHFA